MENLNKKSTNFLLKKLYELDVCPTKVGAMSIVHGNGEIGICLTVSKIILQFNSSPEKEEMVENILKILLKRHFKK